MKYALNNTICRSMQITSSRLLHVYWSKDKINNTIHEILGTNDNPTWDFNYIRAFKKLYKFKMKRNIMEET